MSRPRGQMDHSLCRIDGNPLGESCREAGKPREKAANEFHSFVARPVQFIFDRREASPVWRSK